ncbi:MAG: tRNA preQ1(34) S-adenosylmethionine ribosyltransferase-isomerase QueA [Steroidobacteraceae bacterium]|nr:tRNA preQ1(34) S-adenosylmethionine ribosyltransferase-isomerase QueA [Steroidobacteraceae bacterium]MDW8260179.1 tRNA preQ1(34) S-adenosylmethionine ribosyltransferase-isomerase QueA [Gammaproteobacteria bacterium]
MRREDFRYDLPAELIAQTPLPQRSASRLLTLDGRTGALADRRFADLVEILRPGDLLVLNDTRVIPARLRARKPTGGAVEILLERRIDAHSAWVQMRASKPLRPGLRLVSAGGEVQLLERSGELYRLATPTDPLAFFERYGEMPLPPYITRAPQPEDRERYQSIFARTPGAVAAPTASLHFDAALFERLAERGVERATLTLHVGAGTFQPLRVAQIAEHQMHAEWLSVPAATRRACARARAAGGRVVAVGTTVVRALETVADACDEDRDWQGETRLFITPGYRFRAVDAMITNFHLPESTLLMLVCAFAGREAVLAAYAHAIAERYRFYSYGDAMWLTPAPQAIAAR